MVKLIVVSLAVAVAVFLRSVGGYVEGYVFPVATLERLDRIEQADDVSVRIWGRATRLRTCQFNRLEWRLGTAKSYSVVELAFEETSKVRSAGGFAFGPWRLHLTERQLREKSYA